MSPKKNWKLTYGWKWRKIWTKKNLGKLIFGNCGIPKDSDIWTVSKYFRSRNVWIFHASIPVLACNLSTFDAFASYIIVTSTAFEVHFIKMQQPQHMIPQFKHLFLCQNKYLKRNNNFWNVLISIVCEYTNAKASQSIPYLKTDLRYGIQYYWTYTHNVTHLKGLFSISSFMKCAYSTNIL